MPARRDGRLPALHHAQKRHDPGGARVRPIRRPSLCRRIIEVVRQAPAGATGIAAIDAHGTRPCGGRLIDGKCEFCDVTTIEEGAL